MKEQKQPSQNISKLREDLGLDSVLKFKLTCGLVYLYGLVYPEKSSKVSKLYNHQLNDSFPSLNGLIL